MASEMGKLPADRSAGGQHSTRSIAHPLAARKQQRADPLRQSECNRGGIDRNIAPIYILQCCGYERHYPGRDQLRYHVNHDLSAAPAPRSLALASACPAAHLQRHGVGRLTEFVRFSVHVIQSKSEFSNNYFCLARRSPALVSSILSQLRNRVLSQRKRAARGREIIKCEIELQKTLGRFRDRRWNGMINACTQIPSLSPLACFQT